MAHISITRSTRYFLPALAALAFACAGLTPLAHAQEAPIGNGPISRSSNTLTKLDTLPPEMGWGALANLLDKARPKVDTRLDPTPSQITTYIENLLTRGKNEQALTAIQKRRAELAARPPAGGGTDVQLEFQYARALAALHREPEALAVYQKMTTLYPELPEPWNNLAVLYVAQGNLDQAADALQQALRADPDYVAARTNLADVQTMMAQSNYRKAGMTGQTIPPGLVPPSP